MAEEDVAAEIWDWDWGEPDTESFIAMYSLDDTAANSLRSQSAEVTQTVISEGPLSGANLSACVMVRIRKATAGADVDCQTFLSVVDEKARAEFMAQDQDVMDAVMQEGCLAGNNPSSILMVRIRKVKQSLGKTERKRGGAAKAPAAVVAGGVSRDGSVKPPAAGVGQGGSVKQLGALTGKLNSALWDFDISQDDLIASFKEVMKTRRVVAIAMTGHADSGRAGGGEPPNKKSRGVPMQEAQTIAMSEEDRNLRREEVLQEVVRLVNAQGGRMPLQDVGSEELTKLRKGVVANVAKFLSARPESVTIDTSERIIMISTV